MKPIAGVLALVVLAGSVACGRGGLEDHAEDHSREKTDQQAEDIVLTAEAIRIAGIETTSVTIRELQEELKVLGTVTAPSKSRAVVTPPVAGQVAALHVKTGDRVRKGDPVATLRSGDLAEASAGVIEAEQGLVSAQAAVRESRAEIDLANAKLRTAKQLLARQQAFAKTGAFSQPALQTAQKELADAEAELERGKQDQAVHEAQLERAERLYKQELISRTELEQARLEVATDKIRQRNAERRIDLAKATYERERKIADQGLINSREIQLAEAEVRSSNLEAQRAKIRLASAQSGVAAAKKGIQAARTGYSALAGSSRATGGSLVIRAPITGVVLDLEATLGQAVERTSEICEIEDAETVWVLAQVPDKRLAFARLGAPAGISVSAYPGRIFPGFVEVVGNRLDSKTRAMPVHVSVRNVAGLLKSGMAATVSIGIGSRRTALSVPRSAIVEDGAMRKVYLAEAEGRFEERVVEVGRLQGDFAEITAGVSEGDKVVSRGAFILKSEKVKAELKGHEH